MSSSPVSVRAVTRHAVREQLARMAFNEFCATGFDQVTFADLAGATGVSRSTFLRYFANKEDVVLFVFDPIGDLIVDGLAARSAHDDDWQALRRAFDPVVAFLLRDVAEVITFLRLIDETPNLTARFREKQFEWRAGIVERLNDAEAARAVPVVVTSVRVAAALECFSIALSEWRDSDGAGDLPALLDQAFGALNV